MMRSFIILVLFLIHFCSSPFSTPTKSLRRPTKFAISCKIGGKPQSLTTCSGGGSEIFAYVINNRQGSISVLSLKTGVYIDFDKFTPGFNGLNIAEELTDIFVDEEGKWIYVSSKDKKSIIRIDSVDFSLTEQKLPCSPYAIATAMIKDIEKIIATCPQEGMVIMFDLYEFGELYPDEVEITQIKEGSPMFFSFLEKEWKIFLTHKNKRYLSVLDIKKNEERRVSIYPSCMDDIDNDKDGFIDSEDSGCSGYNDDNEEDDIIDRCTDGIDNDKDGFIDKEDNDCPFDEFEWEILPLCSDGEDNDNDSLVDFEKDKSCYGKFGNYEYSPAFIRSGPVKISPDGKYLFVLKPDNKSIAVVDPVKEERIDVNDKENKNLKGQNVLFKKMGIKDIELPSSPTDIEFFKEGSQIKGFVLCVSGEVYIIEVEGEGGDFFHLKGLEKKIESKVDMPPQIEVDGEELSLVESSSPEYPSLGSQTIFPAGTNKMSYFGVIFNGNPRLELDEKWAITYEGVIPKTLSNTGFIIFKEKKIFDPGKNFCSLGVEKGDILIVKNPVKECGDKNKFEFIIKDVQKNTLLIDTLDGDFPSQNCFKSQLEYEVRLNKQWSVVGSKSGFLHKWKDDGNLCVEIGNEGVEFNSRGETSELKEGKELLSCPPMKDAEEIGWKKFKNHSFEFFIYPPCMIDENFKISMKTIKRETKIKFNVISGFTPKTISIGGAGVQIVPFTQEGKLFVLDSSNENIIEIFAHKEVTGSIYY